LGRLRKRREHHREGKASLHAPKAIVDEAMEPYGKGQRKEGPNL